MSLQEKLRMQIEELERFDRSGLRVAWVKAFGKAPPHYLSMRFMRKALIWEAQRRACGGLSAEVKRALKATQAGKSTEAAPSVVLNPGNQLVREWNGRTYTVDVVENGFVLAGQHYRSLSAIARHITGARWSGPRFFGLTKSGGST